MNPFSVLESDDEEEIVNPPIEIPKKKESKKVEVASTPVTTPVVVPAATNGLKKSKTEEVMLPSRVSGGRGGGRGENDGGRGGTHRHHKPHSEGRGKRRDAEDAPPPRKREFDRRSGTGRGKEISKNGAGKGNWGNAKEEALEAERAPEVALEETVVVDEEKKEEVVPETTIEQAPETQVEVIQAPPTFTLDEYKARLGQSRLNSDAFGMKSERKVDADFNGLKLNEGHDDIFIELKSGKSSKNFKKDQRSDSKAIVLDVGFKSDQREFGSKEGGRGRGRGENRGRGREGRGRAARGHNLDIHDSSAFPSL